MKIEECASAGKILIDCLRCGEMFEVDDFRDQDFAETIECFYETHRLCEKCTRTEEAELAAEAAARRRNDLILRMPKILESAGIEPLYCRDRATGEYFKEPPCRYIAEWIYRHRRENLLISGITGSGKSTSACFIAMQMILAEKRVSYTSLRKLLSRWKAAKTSDRDYAVEKMLHNIFSQDLFIIDEVVGKARISESGQELLFEILESVNSGACRSKIWLLGNFYEGSIEDIFSDPEPVRRRLQENFNCVVIDRAKKSVTPITVWKEK